MASRFLDEEFGTSLKNPSAITGEARAGVSGPADEFSNHSTEESRLSSIERVKRPQNAFMLFSNDRRSVLAKRFPLISNAEISKLLGEEWKNASDLIREQYNARSYDIREAFKKAHPNFEYHPIRRRRSHPASAEGGSKRLKVSPQGPQRIASVSSAPPFLSTRSTDHSQVNTTPIPTYNTTHYSSSPPVPLFNAPNTFFPPPMRSPNTSPPQAPYHMNTNHWTETHHSQQSYRTVVSEGTPAVPLAAPSHPTRRTPEVQSYTSSDFSSQDFSSYMHHYPVRSHMHPHPGFRDEGTVPVQPSFSGYMPHNSDPNDILSHHMPLPPVSNHMHPHPVIDEDPPLVPLAAYRHMHSHPAGTNLMHHASLTFEGTPVLPLAASNRIIDPHRLSFERVPVLSQDAHMHPVPSEGITPVVQAHRTQFFFGEIASEPHNSFNEMYRPPALSSEESSYVPLAASDQTTSQSQVPFEGISSVPHTAFYQMYRRPIVYDESSASVPLAVSNQVHELPVPSEETAFVPPAASSLVSQQNVAESDWSNRLIRQLANPDQTNHLIQGVADPTYQLIHPVATPVPANQLIPHSSEHPLPADTVPPSRHTGEHTSSPVQNLFFNRPLGERNPLFVTREDDRSTDGVSPVRANPLSKLSVPFRIPSSLSFAQDGDVYVGRPLPPIGHGPSFRSQFQLKDPPQDAITKEGERRLDRHDIH
mmetsp:Transcript_34985/g.58537  ORF Transcript_34985/g.58537 Transcript_34985/m.58537 type:complete len:703 (+) Transcript_34985:81-2189(+)